MHFTRITHTLVQHTTHKINKQNLGHQTSWVWYLRAGVRPKQGRDKAKTHQTLWHGTTRFPLGTQKLQPRLAMRLCVLRNTSCAVCVCVCVCVCQHSRRGTCMRRVSHNTHCLYSGKYLDMCVCVSSTQASFLKSAKDVGPLSLFTSYRVSCLLAATELPLLVDTNT